MSTEKLYTLTVDEQKKISNAPFVNTPCVNRDKTKNITVEELYKILSSHNAATRCTFLSYHVTQKTDGTFKINLDMNDYNGAIYEELSDDAKKIVDETISGKTSQYTGSASATSIGMFSNLLINKGTDDEPCWYFFDNIIINVSAGRFTIKNEYNSTTPKRCVIDIKNTNKNEDIYKPFVSNKKLDNVMLNSCFRLMQEGFAAEMNRLKSEYVKYQKLEGKELDNAQPVRFYDNDEINPSIFKAPCLDSSDEAYAPLYRKTKFKVTYDSVMKKNTFETIPCDDVEDHRVQIRFTLSREYNKKMIDDYNRFHGTHFEKTHIRVMSDKNQFNYRYIDTESVGNPEKKNTILDFVSIPTLHRIEKYVSDRNDKPAIHLYRSTDCNMTGNKALHPMFTQYSTNNNQHLNMVISFKCFTNTKSFLITAEPKTFTPIFNVRLDNKRFSTAVQASDDGDIDICEDSFQPVQQQQNRRPTLKEAELDIDEPEEELVDPEPTPDTKEPEEVVITKRTLRRPLPD